jgi:hypothetical protein
MKKQKLKVAIVKEEQGYSASVNVKGYKIYADADSFDELKESILDAVNFTFEEIGIVYALEKLNFEFDIKSFFEFYRIINAKALSERIGMNQSLLAQYISGNKTPSSTQQKRILRGVHEIGQELSEVQFIM